MPTLASLASKVRKLEEQVAPEQTMRCMYVHYGCDTTSDVEARIAREPMSAGGGFDVLVVQYFCEKVGTPHSHADERFWDACHPPRRGW